jgi:hypothetical protein
MTTPSASEATIEVLRYLSAHPGLTDYQLNRHIMGTHGPVAVVDVRREFVELGLAEEHVDEQGWRHWRLTSEGERVALTARPT